MCRSCNSSSRPCRSIEQVQNTPLLIFAVLMFCLAAAFLALWRAAPDFRAFRSLGIFFALVLGDAVIRLLRGHDPLLVVCEPLRRACLWKQPGEAMQIPRRRWTLLFWPVYLFVSVAVWFPTCLLPPTGRCLYPQVAARDSDFPGTPAQKRTRQDDCRRIPVLLVRASDTYRLFPAPDRHRRPTLPSAAGTGSTPSAR